MNPIAALLIQQLMQNPVPWIRAIQRGGVMPAFVGEGPPGVGLPIPLPSATQWWRMNPLEQAGYLQLGQSVGVPPDVMQSYLQASFPPWSPIARPFAWRPGF